MLHWTWIYRPHKNPKFNICFLLCISTFNAHSVSDTSVPDYSHSHIFSQIGRTQASNEETLILGEKGPLPFAVFGNVQKWTNGPAPVNLITQVAQGSFKVNNQWKIVASELYQKQGAVNLTNSVLGVNYKSSKDWSINSYIGAGTNILHTYKYSFMFSPQYKLPIIENGRKIFSTEASVNYQAFGLGSFAQITPKINYQASEYLPPISIAYAFGNFQNSTQTTANNYNTPNIINGATISASLQTTEKSFLIVNYSPNNKQLIGGVQSTADTVSATFNYKIADKAHLSAFSQYGNTRGLGTTLAMGGGLLFSF